MIIDKFGVSDYIRGKRITHASSVNSKSTANPKSTVKCRKKSTAKVWQTRRVRQNAVKKYGKNTANLKSTAKCRKKVRQKYGKPEEHDKNLL